MNESGDIYKIYCDESRQTKKPDFKLIGGIWIKKETGWPFVNEFLGSCMEEVGTMPEHMKWTNIPSKQSSKYFPYYTMLVDLFFHYSRMGKMFFRVILVDRNYIMDHKDYHHGDYEVGFFKLYYYLIFPTLSPSCKYHLRLAKRDVSKKVRNINEAGRFTDLKQILNSAMRTKNFPKYGRSIDYNVVTTIDARVAKQRRLIQLADILMGAIGYHWNLEHLKENASEGKCFLANYISDQLGRKDLKFTTALSSRPFNIFYLQPGKNK